MLYHLIVPEHLKIQVIYKNRKIPHLLINFDIDFMFHCYLMKVIVYVECLTIK
jgi:hypothetical protein